MTYTPQNLRATITALLEDEQRGFSREHLDNFLKGVADAMNKGTGEECPQGSFLAQELQRWKAGALDCGARDMAIYARRIVKEEIAKKS